MDAAAWNTAVLSRALLVLAPLVLLVIATGDLTWLKAGMVTIATFIALERSDVAPFGVLVHGAAILVGFLALLFSLPHPLLFSLLCASMAVGTMVLAGRGAKLRSLGNFTFIPCLYLACEMADGGRDGAIAHGLAFVPSMAIALLPTLVLAIVRHSGARQSAPWQPRHLLRLLDAVDHGPRESNVGSMIAVGLAVAAAAAIIEAWQVSYGQWVVWSAASVVTGELSSARAKLRDRVTGVLMGVPSGIGIGLLLPHAGFVYETATLATMLTLVAFRSYRVGFAVRCACIAIAIVAAGGSAGIAAERVTNVLAGGLLGILFVHACQRLSVAWPAAHRKS